LPRLRRAEVNQRGRREFRGGIYTIYLPFLTKQVVHSVFEMGLELEVKGVNEQVMSDAISLAFRHNLTAYDAYFLALSKKEGKPFIMADYRFLGRVKGFRGIIKLSDISKMGIS
jgi:predicted nucleic acid-binding protein